MPFRLFGTQPLLAGRSTPSVQIDWLAFPHIFEKILQYCDDEALAVLRATCRVVHGQAYDLLVERVALVPRAWGPLRGVWAALVSLASADCPLGKRVALFRNCEAVWGPDWDPASLHCSSHRSGAAAAASSWSSMRPTRSVDVVGRVPAYCVSALVQTMHATPDWELTLRHDARGFHPLDLPLAMPSVIVPSLVLHVELLDACAVGRHAAPRFSTNGAVVHLWFNPDDRPGTGGWTSTDYGPLARVAEYSAGEREVTLIFRPTDRPAKEFRGYLNWLWGDIARSPGTQGVKFTVVNAESLPLAWMDERPSVDARECVRASIVQRIPYLWTESKFNEHFKFQSLDEYATRPGRRRSRTGVVTCE